MPVSSWTSSSSLIWVAMIGVPISWAFLSSLKQKKSTRLETKTKHKRNTDRKWNTIPYPTENAFGCWSGELRRLAIDSCFDLAVWSMAKLLISSRYLSSFFFVSALSMSKMKSFAFRPSSSCNRKSPPYLISMPSNLVSPLMMAACTGVLPLLQCLHN